MNFAPAHRSGQSGVTLVELLVVIVLIAVVASLALMQRGSANEQFQRQNASRELKVAFERARFDSVKRRALASATATNDTRARVVITTNSFTLVTDVNGNGDLVNDDNSFDASDAVVSSLPPNVIIEGNGITLPVTVLFNQRGEATAVSASGINPIFWVCNIDCSAPASATADIVLVTPTGTVNLLPGNGDVPTFSTPTVTSVSTNSGINPDVVLP